MKIYCPSCGTPTNYTSKKPNFCQNCGFSYTKGEMSLDEEESEDQGQRGGHKPVAGDLNSLSVEIQAGEYHGLKIQDVVQDKSAGGPAPEKLKRQAPPKGSGGDIQKQFQKEAGSLKKNKN